MVLEGSRIIHVITKKISMISGHEIIRNRMNNNLMNKNR